jgi:hypothetical protein
MSGAGFIAIALPGLKVYEADRIAAGMKVMPLRTPKPIAQSGA